MAIPSESLQNGSLMGLETEQKEVYELIPLACSRGMLGLGLLPQGCCNKLPHIWWLKTAEIYLLITLEAGSLISITGPKSRCEQSSALSKCFNSHLAFQLLASLASGGITPFSAFVVRYCFPLLCAKFSSAFFLQ